MGKLKKLLHLAGCLLLSSPLWAPISSRLNIQEQDGSPSVFPWQLRVTNGSLTDNGDGTASLSTSGGGGGASLTSTNTWTAGQTFVSSTTFTGAIVISTSVILNGSEGTSGNYFTSNGPGTSATWTDPSLTLLTLSSATATYLQKSSATATYLMQSSATATYLQISSATANYPKLGTGNLFTQSNTYSSSSSTFNGVVIVSTSVSAGGVGTNGQFLTSGGPGAVVSWTNGNAGTITSVVAGTGLTGGGASGAVTLTAGTTTAFTTSTQTFSATQIFTSSTAIKGTASADNAAAGNYGEYMSSTTAGQGINLPISNQYGDLVSLTLTPGDWDATFIYATDRNSATQVQYTDAIAGVSTTSGNSGTGLLNGDSFGEINEGATGISDGNIALANVRFSFSSATPIYGKYRGTYSGGTPVGYGRLSARRVR